MLWNFGIDAFYGSLLLGGFVTVSYPMLLIVSGALPTVTLLASAS